MYGEVIRVYDGDTITVSFCNVVDLRVRLIGVDTPEIRQGEAGKKVRDYVRKLILGKEVRIVTDKRQRGPYGRLLGYVYIGDTFLNEHLITEGLAVPLFYRPNTQYQQDWEYLSDIAREKGAGFWGTGEFNTTPKEFREAQDDI
jgi:micrococcal nuclease